MSKPTTPLSRNRIASSAISRDRAACRIAVTRQRTVIGLPVGSGRLLPVGEAGQHRVDDRVERQPAVDVQLGGEPDLGVDHGVGGQVLDALEGHAVQRLGGLHDADGVRERLQVAHQRSAVRGGAEQRAPARRRRWRAGRRSRSGRPAPAPSRAAARRRGGRAAAPWAPAGCSRASTAVVIRAPHDPIRSMIRGRASGGGRRRR